jgi:hypothetical protein
LSSVTTGRSVAISNLKFLTSGEKSKLFSLLAGEGGQTTDAPKGAATAPAGTGSLIDSALPWQRVTQDDVYKGYATLIRTKGPDQYKDVDIPPSTLQAILAEHPFIAHTPADAISYLNNGGRIRSLLTGMFNAKGITFYSADGWHTPTVTGETLHKYHDWISAEFGDSGSMIPKFAFAGSGLGPFVKVDPGNDKPPMLAYWPTIIMAAYKDSNQAGRWADLFNHDFNQRELPQVRNKVKAQTGNDKPSSVIGPEDDQRSDPQKQIDADFRREIQQYYLNELLKKAGVGTHRANGAATEG